MPKIYKNFISGFRKAISNVSVGKNMFIQGCMIAVLMTVLICTNFWAIHIINNQLIETNRKMLKLYTNKLDEQLYDIEKQMARFIVDNSYFFRGVERKDKESPYMAKKLDTLLKSSFIGYQDMGGVFIYNTLQDTFISYNISDTFYNYPSLAGDWFKNQCKLYEKQNTSDTRHWICRKVDDDYSLIRIMKSGHFYIGGYIKTDRILNKLDDEYKNSYEHLIFKDEKDNLMTDKQFNVEKPMGFQNKNTITYSLEDGSKFTALERKSSVSSLKLVAFHRNTALILGLQGMQVIVFLLANVFLVFMGGLIWYTRQNLIMPITSLVTAMEQVKQGSLEVRIQEKAHYQEFQKLFERFNEMVMEIKALKIDVYEKKINNQRTRLKFLKLQINPHFFLNSLNVIYSLALTQNIAVIKEMVMRLTRHSRYMLKIDNNLVQLKDESGYIDNYIEIQKLRYSFQLKYTLEAEEITGEYKIPPLLIYTFVENAVKYGLREERGEIEIRVKAHIVKYEEKEYLEINIEDNGPGFSDEKLLSQLNAGEIIVDPQGEEHYGIANVKQRLDILYGPGAAIRFGNRQQGGALVHMVIPADITEEG